MCARRQPQSDTRMCAVLESLCFCAALVVFLLLGDLGEPCREPPPSPRVVCLGLACVNVSAEHMAHRG